MKKVYNYNGLAKETTKALGIFEKTKLKLIKVVDKMNTEINKNSETVQKSKEEIKDAEDATRYLDGQVKKVNKTIENIDKIMV